MKSLSHQFLDFCRSKPRDEEFDYSLVNVCAWGQFCTAQGIEWKDTFPPIQIDEILNPNDEADSIIDDECKGKFGALVDRLEASLTGAA